MKRNSNTLFLESPNAVTPLRWVDGQPDFSGFIEPTLSVLQTAWQEFVESGQDLEVITDPELIPEPIIPNWDGFNAAMLGDTAFNQTIGYLLGVAPSVAIAIPTALAQVSTNGLTAFTIVFNAFCQYGNVTLEQRENWATIAESFNLPVEFTSVVRGET